MSLLTETVRTVIDTQVTTVNHLFSPLVTGQVQTARASLVVPAQGGLPADGAEYPLLLSSPVPKGAFVYQTIIDVIDGLYSDSNSNSILLGLDTNIDVSDGTISISNLTSGALGTYTQFVTNTSHSTLLCTVTDTDPLTAGHLQITILYV